MTKQQRAQKNGSATRRIWMWAIGSLLALGFGAAVVSIALSFPDKSTLTSQGVEVQAQVTDHYYLGGSNRGTNYNVSYQFTPRGAAKPVEKKAEPVSMRAWQDMSEGDAVTVTYLPSDPSVSQLSSQLHMLPTLLVATVSLASFIGGAWLFAGVKKRLPGLRLTKKARSERVVLYILGNVLLFTASVGVCIGLGIVVLRVIKLTAV